jgi:hypothetical protein
MARPGRRRADDEKLMLALACGATVDVAARQAGISSSTVIRRRADPEFQRRLRAIRGEMIERTAGALTAAATESVRTLLELQKPAAPPAVRLGAARAILEVGLRIRELVDLEVDMNALERRLQEIEGGG